MNGYIYFATEFLMFCHGLMSGKYFLINQFPVDSFLYFEKSIKPVRKFQLPFLIAKHIEVGKCEDIVEKCKLLTRLDFITQVVYENYCYYLQ